MAIRDLGLPPREPEKPYLVPPRKTPRWKRVVAWAAGILVALILVIVIGVYVLLHTAAFHNYVLGTVDQKASAALNTRVDLQNFALHLSTLGLDLYGLTIYGVGPGANTPLLQADHLAVGVTVTSFLHRQWYLNYITIDHPVAKLIVDANGNTNLPTLQSSGNSNTNVFDLAIRHILLDRGEVYYNDRKLPLNADLHELQFKSSYDTTGGGRYYGTVSYRDGHLQYGTYAPLPHDLQAQFDARRSGMTLSNVTLKSGQSQVLLNASLDNYANPKLHANYVVILALGELRNVLQDPTLPAGVVLLNGNADYVSVPGKALLDNASLQGSIRSRELQVRTPSLRTDIRDLNARYNLANGNAEVQDLSARLLGGTLSGRATVRDLSGKQQGQATIALRDLSLADLKSIANSATLKPIAISGRVNANSEATWSGSLQNLVLKADATARGNLASSRPGANPGSVPLNADIHARYNGASQEIALNQSYLRTPQTSINLDGTVSKHSALQVRVRSNDLHELETVADLFSQPGTQPLGLHGTASFDGTVRGSTGAPQIAGQLQAANVRLRGSSFRVLRTGVEASPSRVSLQNGVLDVGKQGHVNFNVQSGLHQWSHLPSSPFDVTLSATQLSVDELARAANVSTPVSGTLNANVAAHGTQLNPIGQGNVTLRNAVISGEPVQSAQVRFQGTGDEVHANLQVRVSAGTAQGQLTYYPKSEGYDALLQATNIHLAQLQTLRQRNIQAAGTLNLTASGKGTLKDPQGTASLTIPELDLQKQQVRDVTLQASVANHQANFTLGSEVINTPLRAVGRISLVGNYDADITVDTPVIQLQPLLAVYSPGQAARTTGQTEIHASLKGPLKNKELLQAHVNIPTLAVNYQTGATISNQAPSFGSRLPLLFVPITLMACSICNPERSKAPTPMSAFKANCR